MTIFKEDPRALVGNKCSRGYVSIAHIDGSMMYEIIPHLALMLDFCFLGYNEPGPDILTTGKYQVLPTWSWSGLSSSLTKEASPKYILYFIYSFLLLVSCVELVTEK